MKKKILSVAILSAILPLLAEVSAFDAGNLNSQNPYGLTDSEKEVLKNRQNVASLESSLGSIEEQIQGMQSLLEGVSARMSRLEQRVNELEIRINGDTNSSGESIASLKAYVDDTRALQEKNYKNITDTLNKLGSLIDKKSSQTITKTESASPKTELSKKSNKEIFDEAVKLFNSNKNDEAKAYFEHLISKNNRPATSNFYLGEIAYKEKSYATAIKHYQKSIELDDKASYLPKLLYHTGISFDKVGDTNSANRFYRALKVGYPDTKEAQATPERK
ncbi:tetratricopeptide repeat protein [Campylobacter gastrosuis]|uniref:Tetratricopeptide repeat protein n=1 Tax=Campylobacter gastrosuis TaxID=2974576 RepID=A0ABT7HR76_9BACT|nr:tetratricopeptide repeat protein [Campylobacter gastrosuis]MDL0088894.1 tetratricopeptide repeat protein [Campylobacter gastrosuis]